MCNKCINLYKMIVMITELHAVQPMYVCKCMNHSYMIDHTLLQCTQAIPMYKTVYHKKSPSCILSNLQYRCVCVSL